MVKNNYSIILYRTSAYRQGHNDVYYAHLLFNVYLPVAARVCEGCHQQLVQGARLLHRLGLKR